MIFLFFRFYDFFWILFCCGRKRLVVNEFVVSEREKDMKC